MENTITKNDEGFEMVKKRLRFYLNTPEKFAEALTVIKQYEDFFAEMKESVKERGREIMDKRNLKEIEFGNFVVRRMDPTETNEWNSHSVISSFVKHYGVEEGLTMVSSFIKTSGASLEKWFMKGRVPMEIITDAKSGMKVKLKKGFIGLYPKKEKKAGDGPIYIKG